MFDVRQTRMFRDWLAEMRDAVAVKAIKRRIARVQVGLFGDVKIGRRRRARIADRSRPGYRVYFARRDDAVILLLCGGDTSSQQRDIARATALAEQGLE